VIEQIDVNGDPFVGTVCRANDKVVLVPTGTKKTTLRRLSDVLGNIDVVEMTLGGSLLLGSLCVMNSKGAIVPDLSYEEELGFLKGYVTVELLTHRLNAYGNNVLVNDNGGMAHPGYSQRAIKQMEDLFGVEVVRGTVAGVRTVGSVAVATNKGVLCHPKTDVDEMAALRDVFKVNVEKGTSNYGSPMLGACITANSFGALTGRLATGIELGRIEDALGLF
jgi:translation initiation factor 6